MLVKKGCIVWVLLFASSFLIIEVGLATYEGPWTTGYAFCGFEAFPGPGLKGDIYTIDPAMEGLNNMYESLTIVLSYYNYWWLQWGYMKGWSCIPLFSAKYYYEVWDSIHLNPGPMKLTQGPSPGTWHRYYIMHPFEYGECSDPHFWEFYLEGGALYHYAYVFPYYAVDQRAYIETSTNTIRIDGSHYKDLSYFIEIHYWHWQLWDEHVTIETDPQHYHLNQVSDSEFTAWGGA